MNPNTRLRPTVVRSMPWPQDEAPREVLLDKEWLVTNGLGGYASGTVSGAVTRKYHGLLIAALPAPLGRTVMWNHLAEHLRFPDGEVLSLGSEERSSGQLDLHGADYLREFRLEDGLPVWLYHVREFSLTKRVVLPHLQNTAQVAYELTGDGELPLLELRPAFHFRHHESPVDAPLPDPYNVDERGDGCYEITGHNPALPALRLRLCGAGAEFAPELSQVHQILYRTEQERGYAHAGDLWSPGVFQLMLNASEPVAVLASTEPWEAVEPLDPQEVLAAERERRTQLLAQAPAAARTGVAAELVLAADQFVISPATRAGEPDRRTVIAGYHWFTDWGRDTMISLEGLTLTTGRTAEAGAILRTFAHYVRDGLIPNMFPDEEEEGLYHTADATLWFFHALGRYLQQSGDRKTLERLLPTLVEIADAHLRGTKFNIHVDPADGLLVQGREGYQLTWMDAKMDDWVVTPRRGKAVEINALWHNALRLLESWLRETGDNSAADRYAEHARRAFDSFNRRFWSESGGYLFDIVDDLDGGGDDSACRPNQIFAISLDYPVLQQDRWPAVVDVVQRELLTPVGLRSLSPAHPDYQPTYHGDLRTRDGAYHQGTVWGWLIGPFVDAWLKVHPGENTAAREFLAGFPEHLDDAGLGSISEIFDAQEPHLARGCIAQAWSVAEVLRCWLKTNN